jgi:flagellar basal-body rod protein FlgB
MIIKSQVIDKAGIPFFKKFLRVTSTAQKLTATNIANVSTPGYQSKSINFKKEMQSALKNQKISLNVTNNRHIPALGQPDKIKVIADRDNSNKSGLNNIDIDKEMSSLAENQILYTFGTKMLTRKFNALKTVIRGKR